LRDQEFIMSVLKQCTTAVLVLASSFTLTLAAGKPVADLPILVSFGQTESDALTSDGFIAPGFFDDYADGVENVLAIIQGSGNLRFGMQRDVNRAALRSMCVNFGDQFAAQGMVVPFVDGNARQCVNVLQPMHAYATGDVSIAAATSTAPCAKWVLAPSSDGAAALFRFKLTTKKGAVQEGSPEFVANVVMPFVQTLTRK
jgi:hypothetical protein